MCARGTDLRFLFVVYAYPGVSRFELKGDPTEVHVQRIGEFCGFPTANRETFPKGLYSEKDIHGEKSPADVLKSSDLCLDRFVTRENGLGLTTKMFFSARGFVFTLQ